MVRRSRRSKGKIKKEMMCILSIIFTISILMVHIGISHWPDSPTNSKINRNQIIDAEWTEVENKIDTYI